MNTMKGKHLLLALCLAAALLLASCGPKAASAQGSSQSASSADTSAGGDASDEEEDVPTQTLHGTVNLVDEELELLVLVSDGSYYKFDTAKADLSGLSQGDEVTVTYTGTLEAGSDYVTAVLVSVAVEQAPSD